MRIMMDAVGGRSILPVTPSKLLLNSFAYADTGSLANHKIFKPMHLTHTWKSEYGVVVVEKYWKDDSRVIITMETGCETSLVAKALGVFEHFMHNSILDVQDIHILDGNRNINIRMEDLNADNLCRLTLPTSTFNGWWDSNVLPILEKIW